MCEKGQQRITRIMDMTVSRGRQQVNVSVINPFDAMCESPYQISRFRHGCGKAYLGKRAPNETRAWIQFRYSSFDCLEIIVPEKIGLVQQDDIRKLYLGDQQLACELLCFICFHALSQVSVSEPLVGMQMLEKHRAVHDSHTCVCMNETRHDVCGPAVCLKTEPSLVIMREAREAL